MKNFFISQCTLLLLALHGNIIGMHHVTKNLVSKNSRAHSIPLSLKKDHNQNNSPGINSKDHENKQDHYILSSRFNGQEDKMAYYKQWQR